MSLCLQNNKKTRAPALRRKGERKDEQCLKIAFVLLASSLLLGICPAALAQQVESQDKSWLQTFTGLAQNTAPEENAAERRSCELYGAMRCPRSREISPVLQQGAAGKFGKKADDMAFVARTKWGRRLASYHCAGYKGHLPAQR